MPKVSIVRHKENLDWWLVEFEYPDLHKIGFGFATKGDALNAIKLAQYFRDNEVSFKEIDVED